MHALQATEVRSKKCCKVVTVTLQIKCLGAHNLKTRFFNHGFIFFKELTAQGQQSGFYKLLLNKRAQNKLHNLELYCYY